MSAAPLSWEEAEVGEVATLTDGPFGSNLKTAHYVEGGPRVVRLQNIGDGFFRDERAHITEAHFMELRKHEVLPGDIVVASLGDDAPRAALVPAWLGPAIVKADCIRVRPVEGIEPAFLMWMLNSPPVRRSAATAIKGIGRPRLGLRGIQQLRVPVPPLAEQRRIVAAIEEQFSWLEAAERSFTTVEARLATLPAIVLEATLQRFPNRVRLHEVAEVRLGRQRSPKNHSGPNMTPYLRAANVTWAGLDLVDVKSMHFAPAEIETYRLQPGDVLLSEASGSAGEVGKPAIWRGEFELCCFQNTLIRVRSRDPRPEFLRLVFLHAALTGQFATAAPGVGIHHLGSSRLASWPIPVVSDEEQLELVADVERELTRVAALRTAVLSARKRSAALRRAILESAFRGELAPQDPGDETASALLERIRGQRAAASTVNRRKRVPA